MFFKTKALSHFLLGSCYYFISAGPLNRPWQMGRIKNILEPLYTWHTAYRAWHMTMFQGYFKGARGVFKGGVSGVFCELFEMVQRFFRDTLGEVLGVYHACHKNMSAVLLQYFGMTKSLINLFFRIISLPCGPKKSYYAVLANFWPFLVFSSILSNL